MGYRLALALLVSLAPVACRRGSDPAPWIDESAAVVHCTTAGPTRMPPLMLGLPFPAPPTGLYARGMDPMALVDMGFERDAPVCAALLAPDEESARNASPLVSLLSELIDGTSDAVVRGVACPCETADALGVRSLVARCATIPARRCEDSPERREALSLMLTPLVDAIESTAIPRVHWRLAGPTDRPSWFADRHTELLERHAGGSIVYLPGQAIPARDNFLLIRALLAVDGVVAVARQDGGRAVLVARVLDGTQVFDHFELPPLRPELAGLRGYFDNARPSDIVDALAKPVRSWTPLLPANDGNFAELDVKALERVDEMLVALSSLTGAKYDVADEVREEPELYVARVAVQAPFGADGQALRVAASLTDYGSLWATALQDTSLSGDLSPLDLSGKRTRFVASRQPPPAFALRGTETNSVLAHGLHAMGEVLGALEAKYPGAVDGSTRDWDVRLPQGSLGYGGAVVPTAGLRSVAAQVLERAYRVTATIDPSKGTIVADIKPD